MRAIPFKRQMRYFSATLLGGLWSAVLWAGPLDNIPGQGVGGSMTSPPNFGWDWGYDIDFTDSTLNVGMDIKLEPSGGTTQAQVDALKDTWENGIESMWNNKFDIIKDGKWRFPIKINVNWVDPHHTVKVVPGPHRSKSNEWDTQDTGNVVAHEFGHLLGLFDEYVGGALDPSSTVDGGSIQGSTADSAAPKARHYKRLTDWLKAKSPTQTFTVEPHVTGIGVVGSLSNFDVTNNSKSPANDFELVLKGIKAADVAGTFPGFGSSPTMTDQTNGVKVHWSSVTDSVAPGGTRHFGVKFKDGVNPEGASATWTQDNCVVGTNLGLGLQHYWTALQGDGHGIADTIRNLTAKVLTVEYRYTDPIATAIPLDSLTSDLQLPLSPWGPYHLTTIMPGGYLFTPFHNVPLGGAVLSQVIVHDPADFSKILAVFTDEGVGAALPSAFGLVTGDFDLNGNWDAADLPVMQLALGDPTGFMNARNLGSNDLLHLGDLDRDGFFDLTDYGLAQNWVPLDNTIGGPGQVPEPGLAAAVVAGLLWGGLRRRRRA